MSKKVKCAVFASGNGSNFEAIVEAVKAEEIDIQISLLVCDQANAYVLKRAGKHDIPSQTFILKDFEDKASYESAIVKTLKEYEIDLILLAGYMKIINETILSAYTTEILNIHPSLLPKHPGKQGIKDAFDEQVDETGVTVHIVDQGIDTGPIIAQEKVAIEPRETLESLEEKIHQIEHKLYPKAIQQYIEKKKEQIKE